MSNTYDSMAGALASGNELGNIALVSSLIACTVWPEHLLAPIPAAKSGILLSQLEKRVPVKTVNLPVHGAVQVGPTNVPTRLALIRTDTGKMLQACSRIHESGSAGLRYLEELNKQYYSVSPATWESNDQAAYSKQLLDYRNSVQNTYCLAWETALLTPIVATLRFLQLAIAAVTPAFSPRWRSRTGRWCSFRSPPRPRSRSAPLVRRSPARCRPSSG
jgi:hypothetical protein